MSRSYTLRRQGIDVTLFEASDRAGVRMAGEVVDGFYVDSGACIFHETQDDVNRFSKELGVSYDHSPRGHVGTIYIGGKARHLNMERKLALVNFQTLLSLDLFSLKELRTQPKSTPTSSSRCAMRKSSGGSSRRFSGTLRRCPKSRSSLACTAGRRL